MGIILKNKPPSTTNKQRRKALRYFSKNLGHTKQEKKRCTDKQGTRRIQLQDIWGRTGC